MRTRSQQPAPLSQTAVFETGTYAGLARRWMHETLCALHGHDLMLHFDRGRRICLRCASCGHETAGWKTN